MCDDDKEIEGIKCLLNKIKDIQTEKESKCNLNKMVYYINLLNNYMEEKICINDKDIQSMIDYIVGYNTRVFDSILPCNTKIKRGQIVNIELCKSVKRLSYNTNKKKISQGRFNRGMQSVFYGVIHFNQNSGINIVFSELCAKEKDRVSILNSITNKEVIYRQLGLFTRIHNDNKPWYIDDHVWQYYSKIYKLHKNILYESCFISFLLAEFFLYNTLSKKGSKSVYDITNAIADILLDNEKIDGLIFDSIFDNNTPNIILKSCMVDEKLTFLDVDSFIINKIYPYNLYRASISHKGKILHTGDIEWELCHVPLANPEIYD